jgi:hypothetical protein
MWYRLLVFTVPIAAGLIGLMGALGFPSSPACTTLPLPPNVPDGAAQQTIDLAIAALAPERIGYVETKLWQKVTLPNLTYKATGRYIMGPERRFRLEMHTKQGDGEGTLLTVSDGATLWEANRVGSGEWDSVTRLDLAPVIDALDGEGTAALLRMEFLTSPRFAGIVPLLRDLRVRMNWVGIQSVNYAGKRRLRLTGVWTPDFATYIRLEQAWPAGLPEQCRLDLDPQTLWPNRLEWWGPATDGAADTLLAQIELRDPVVHSRLTAERCAKEFTFQPGDARVDDLTDSVKAGYKARLKPRSN